MKRPRHVCDGLRDHKKHSYNQPVFKPHGGMSHGLTIPEKLYVAFVVCLIGLAVVELMVMF